MALVGDVIIQARETIPDMPQTVANPVLSSLVPTTVVGGTFPAGTWFVVVTLVNQWGETLASNEESVLVTGPDNAIIVTYAGMPGDTSVNIYFGNSSGAQLFYIQSPDTNGPVTVSSIVGGVPAQPPTRNSAWLPDTDGDFISAAAIFRWVNSALTEIGRLTGGLQDYAGVGSTIGQPFYTVPGQWNDISSIWYDGYWMSGSGNSNIYKRTAITSSILSYAALSVQDNRMIIEVYPQPARTASLTALTGDMSASATVANVVNSSGFLLPFGFLQVDSEIMSYATINGNQFTGLIRGLGGSAAVAHLATAPVQELNLVIAGKRQMVPTYVPGNSNSTLLIPPGWEILMYNYVAGRSKIIEHDFQAMTAFTEEMRKQIKEWALAARGVVKRRQIGSPNTPVTYFGDIAGGLIVP